METGNQKSGTIVAKRQWSKEEKQSYIQDWKQSRLNYSQYCQQKGLSVPTFTRWVRQSKKKTSPSLTFIEMPVKKEKEETGKQAVEIQLANGILCRFQQVTNMSSIKQLIQELKNVTAD